MNPVRKMLPRTGPDPRGWRAEGGVRRNLPWDLDAPALFAQQPEAPAHRGLRPLRLEAGGFSASSSVEELYRALGERHGVTFTPGLRDVRDIRGCDLELGELSLVQSLDPAIG